MASAPTTIQGTATAAPIRRWLVQSSAKVVDDGQALSAVDYRAEGWFDAPARSTVMAALLANGCFPNVFFSTTMRDIDATQFQVPWWYRTVFVISGGGRTFIRIEGVIHKCEVWVNGTRVADHEEVAGAYPVHTFDVTGLVGRGENALALKVFPGHPMTDLSVGWIDWNPMPPDANMGVWRDVVVLRTGDIRLADAHVRSEVSSRLDRADLRIAVDVENAACTERVATLSGWVDGPSGQLDFSREVRLAAGERRRVVLTSAEVPALAIGQPRLWWPVGHGEQAMHELRLAASVGGITSDQVALSFGIRQVTSRIEKGGGRRFVVNHRPVHISGAGWAPDIFLRYDRQRLVDEMSYVLDMGLNALRLEGKLETPEFYDLADRLGVMVLAGWECCDKWEAHAGTGGSPWSERDYLIARRSMASEARLLRNHPSVVSFQIGSDFAPPPKLANIYVNELESADWALPIVSSGASEWNNDWSGGPNELGTTATEGAGPSGMKMWPYDWVPPVYWYGHRYGAAIGFDSECSAGHSIPSLSSLRRMFTPAEMEQLWQQPAVPQYHAGPPSPFDNIAIFHAALAARYGAIASLADFLRKARLANYEMVRAQFEAYGGRDDAEEPATGVIYWMLNTAWPSLNWHLYDYYLDPAGAYFGAKKANGRLHIQFSYDTGEVRVVNRSPDASGPLYAELVVRDIDGSVRDQRTCDLASLDGSRSVTIGLPEVPGDISTTYFLELVLCDGERALVSRNVYWLSTKPDVVDWEKTFWQHSPQAGFADLTGLEGIPVATIETTVSSSGEINGLTSVTVRNISPTPAVGVHCSIVAGDNATPVTPVLWDDNDVTLFGGQAITLTARYSVPCGDSVRVQIGGFNVNEQAVIGRPALTAPKSPS